MQSSRSRAAHWLRVLPGVVSIVASGCGGAEDDDPAHRTGSSLAPKAERVDSGAVIEGISAWNVTYPRPTDAVAQSNRLSCAYHRGQLPAETLGPTTRLDRDLPVEHIVVLMQENRSFDSYLGHLARYEASIGLKNTIDSAPDDTSNPDYPLGQPGASTLPAHEKNARHPYVHAPALCAFDTAHLWADAHLQYDFGRNDGFYFTSQGAGDPNESVLGIAPKYLDGDRALYWYDERDIPFYYDLYSTFAMADAYHSDLLGPTYPNRMYLYSATSFGVTDNVFPDLASNPYRANGEDPALVFDLLEARGIAWGIYSEAAPALGVVLGTRIGSRYGKGHTHAVTDFLAAAKEGTLPVVSFVDADFTLGGAKADDEHPPADIEVGQHFVWEMVRAVTTSPSWQTTALFLTYEENGGLYDHVAPPSACVPDHHEPVYGSPFDASQPAAFDRYGFRVPFVVVSPYAKRSFVSHAVYSHASITRFIEAKAKVPALTARDANADPFTDLFDWDDPPFLTPPVFAEPVVHEADVATCRATLTPHRGKSR